MRVISGKKRGLKLESKKESNVRPTLDRVKENVFNIIYPNCKGAVFLDLFGGFGGMGIEAYSRGAKEVYIFEKDKENFNIILKNISKLNLSNKNNLNSNIKAFNIDYEIALKKISKNNLKADLIYIDPPYFFDLEMYIKIIENILSLNILKEDSILIIESEEDMQKKIVDQIEKLDELKIIDKRIYGKVALVFIQGKE